MLQKTLKIFSWNVNGIRAVLKKNFLDFVAEEKLDILCLQETKAHPEQLDKILVDYHQFWSSAEKKGYSGTAVFSKIMPEMVHYGIGKIEHDQEGRVITLEFKKYFLVNVYTPNSKRGLLRLKYRKEWDRDFLAYLKKLEKTKPIIVCGDLNVAHKEIDLARPKDNIKNAGFTQEEREGFDKIVAGGFVDTFRLFNKEGKNYTWWSHFANSRQRNIGWRIDYFLVSARLKKQVKNAFILPKVMGSDHCPVGIKFQV